MDGTGTVEPGALGLPVVIQSKLVPPPLPEHFAERPRLEKLVANLFMHKRVAAVTAAAGSGKTTAVVGAVRSAKRPVAWLTVDRSDAAPGRLLTYLEAAVARVVPAAQGVATGAVAAGIPHAEAAGLLAETLGPDRVILVLDELERLGEEPEAWRVIEALVRHQPLGACVVLIGRRAIPTALCALPAPPAVGVLTDGDVAFTSDEAALALSNLGSEGFDADAAVASTGGWVTGVLFEAWRSSERLGGEREGTDPLYEYLASQMLSDLGEPARDFLVETSLLDEVTAPRAEALGIDDAGELMGALRGVHLPVTWAADGCLMRVHSFFREYLLTLLDRRGDAPLRGLRIAHGRLLAAEGHHEDAVEAFLRAGAPDEALAPAEVAIVGVVERLDLAVAERWLAALEGVERTNVSPLATAELMIALASDEIERGLRMAERLAAGGDREALAESSERAAWLMSWCYLHHGRYEDVDALIEVAPPGAGVDVLRYAMSALTDRPGVDRPAAPGSPGGALDAMLCIADYARGRLSPLVEPPASSWLEAVEAPWRIAALRARGRTKQALAEYERTSPEVRASGAMVTLSGPELLMDAGRWEDAETLIRDGRARASASGSLAYLGLNRLLEAKLALRWTGDAAAARAALERPESRRAVERFRFIAEIADAWEGLALLLDGLDAEALERLRDATRSMVAGDRTLELPVAAVFLAEAEWRAGEHDAADAAAELALGAARAQGSNHLLLQALAFFPAVVSRRVDAEPGTDSAWHELGRALLAQGVAVGASVQIPVLLHEFGRRALLVDGGEVKPRIAKSYELLAYVIAHPARECDRDELLDVLFDGRRDDSSRAYLRQAIRWLREALGEGAFLAEGQVVRVGVEVGVSSESVDVETMLAEAARLQGSERRAATVEALAVYDQGPYLPGARGAWADEREQRLATQTTEARYQAAVLSFGEDRYEECGTLTEAVLRDEPYREAAWRLSMRVSLALGDDDGAIRAYKGCEQALSELDATPSKSTQLLLARARR